MRVVVDCLEHREAWWRDLGNHQPHEVQHPEWVNPIYTYSLEHLRE